MSSVASAFAMCLVLAACVESWPMVNAGFGRSLEGAPDELNGRALLAMGSSGPVCTITANCAEGLCCSKDGHCGKGVSHCGINGKKSKGPGTPTTPAATPNPTATPATGPTTPTAISTTTPTATSAFPTTSTPQITAPTAGGQTVTPALATPTTAVSGRNLRDVGFCQECPLASSSCMKCDVDCNCLEPIKNMSIVNAGAANVNRKLLSVIDDLGCTLGHIFRGFGASNC